jgi:hypothetical protein
MSRQFQFSLKWLFVLMLVVAAFIGGIHFERERRRRAEEAEASAVYNELLEFWNAHRRGLRVVDLNDE